MCIIIAKDKKAKLPSIENITQAFLNNDDGAGFMYVDNGKVVIDKGYMALKSFIKHYKKLCKKYNNFENKALVIHCRIGTSGKNSRENCHPYPISKNINNLKKTYYKTNLGVVHNGIIYDYNHKTDDIDINDTQNFIINFLSELYYNYKEFYKNDKIMSGIEHIIKSKMCFLDSKENLYFIGDFIKENGVLYSNNTYKNYYYKSWENYNWSSYADQEAKTPPKFEDNLIKLHSNWNVYDDDGEFYQVGDKDLYIDADTYQLYEKNLSGNISLISNSSIIYNEFYEMLY